MKNIGTYTGAFGLERLLAETCRLQTRQRQVIIAVAGLPGSGKTHLVKNFARLGFGPFSRKEVLVIDDNMIYTARLWRLHWQKIQLSKTIWRDFVRSRAHSVIILANWIPSRKIDFADILVTMTVDETTRHGRLIQRYRGRPDKVPIQQAKTTIPIEEPFDCQVRMALADFRGEARRWAATWLLKRQGGKLVGKNRFGSDRKPT